MRGKGEGSIFKNSRGLWTGVIELPPSPNGDRRRKVIRRKNKSELLKEVAAFKQRVKESGGDAPTSDRTVAQWMREWHSTIAIKNVRPKTANTYRGLMEHHIIPTIGGHRLEKLTPKHVRDMNEAIVASGLSSTTARQTHRVLAVALKYALREGLIARNVATLVDAPPKAEPHLEALTLEEGIAVIETAANEQWGSLWAAVLLTGARQGELLGLELARVTDVLDISLQLQRLPWRHGCNPECGQRQGAKCPDRAMPAPANWAGKHLSGGLWLAPPKTSRGKRIIPLVEPLKSILARHIEFTRDMPNPHGLVWRLPNGNPLDPKMETRLWHDLLKRAGVTDVRLHDGRHTTVDLLLELGVHEDLIMDIVGHSSRATTRGYKSRAQTKRVSEALDKLSAPFLTLGASSSKRE